MGNVFYFEWEHRLILWLQNDAGAFIQVFARVFSFLGSEIFLVPLLLFIYLSVSKRLAVYAGVNAGVTLVLSPVVKNLACRRRPYFDLKDVKCLAPVDNSAPLYDIAAQGWSLPSAHSANSVTILGSFAAKAGKSRVKYFCAFVILCIGVSRFASGNHFPTDVLCGWLLGIFSMWLTSRLSGMFKNKASCYAAISAVSLLGCFWCRTNDYFSGLSVMLGVFAGNLYEEKYVNFEETRVLKWRILRFAGGMCVFLLISQGVKLFFSREFLETISFWSCALRVFRYGMGIFVTLGVYPKLFKIVEKHNIN